MRLAGRLLAGPDADLHHLPLSLDPRAVSLGEGIRAGFAVAALVACNEWLRAPALGEAALGALLTCLCDPGGAIRKRVRALATFVVAGSLAMFAFAAIRATGLWPASLAGSLFIFAAMFARAWGPSAMQVGNLLTVVCVLALDIGHPLAVAAHLALWFAAGSIWALALTLLIWRIHPYRPARAAVADIYRRLAVLARDLSDQIDLQAHPDWGAHARAHRRYVRDGIELARTEVAEILRARGPGSARGNALTIHIETAEQIFGAVIGLSDLLEQEGRAHVDSIRPALPALRLALAAIADGIVEDTERNDRHRALIQHLLERIEGAAQDATLSQVLQTLLTRLRVAALMVLPENQTVSGLTPAETRRSLREALGPLRSNLAWQSAALRHAVRTSVIALPALLLTLSSGVVYAHWLTITLVLTLQPFFALTWQRAVERCGGTVLGGVLAALLATVVHGPVPTAALLVPLLIVAFAVRRVSFGLFMATLTPVIVLLSELGQPGVSEFSIALARAGYTVLGGVMAVLGGLALWPSWEPARVRTDLGAAIRAHAAYADAVLAWLERGAGAAGAEADALEPARRVAGLASNTLETTLARALQEPGHDARRDIQTALLADAALRRVAGRLAALQAAPDLAQSADLPAWRGWVEASFAALADSRPIDPHHPADAPTGALSRLARQLTLIDGALRQTQPA